MFAGVESNLLDVYLENGKDQWTDPVGERLFLTVQYLPVDTEICLSTAKLLKSFKDTIEKPR